MHKVFGFKENAEYIGREGAYLVPVNSNKIGVIKTPKGYFFLAAVWMKMKITKNVLKENALKKLVTP